MRKSPAGQKKHLNKIVKTLIVSDLFFNSGWGLSAPVFAIFIMQSIASGDAAQGARIAGFASLCYWLVKSMLQIPIGHYLDKNQGERDDFWFMVAGTFLAGLAPFGYMLSSQTWHIYCLQAVHAIGMAMAIPAWSAIFTRHIDKGREALEWGVESTALGFGAGIAGAIGGLMAAALGFKVIFMLVGGFTIFSSGLLFLIRKEITPSGKTPPYAPLLKTPF